MRHRSAGCQADPARLLVKATGRAGKPDPFKPWINQRWNQGITNAAALHAEMARHPGPDRQRPGRRALRTPVPRRRRPQQGRPEPLQAPPVTPAPKTREVTPWLLTHPGNLDPADQARLDAVTAQCPHLDDLARHALALARIMARRQGLLQLEDWLAGAEASDLPQLRSFARGIRRDQQAVTAGLSLP
jgi:hypothetical protein